MKIVYMGTPDFAVPPLEMLAKSGHEICCVVTQQDKPKNRGMKLQPTPVKACALAHELPVYQPASMKEDEPYEYIKTMEPDLIVVAAYGQILPQRVLDIPRLGCINIHSSILPKYRGAAPINWAILNGETETGVSIMYMVKKLDAGDVIDTAKLSIGENETVEELHDRLSEAGAQLLEKVLPMMENGTAVRTPQVDEESTYASMLSKEMSIIDWSRSAQEIHNQVRGLQPWPGAITHLNGVRCKLFETRIRRDISGKGEAGTVVNANKNGLHVVCGDGTILQINVLQADGSKRAEAVSYLNGHPIPVGTVAGQ